MWLELPQIKLLIKCVCVCVTHVVLTIYLFCCQPQQRTELELRDGKMTEIKAETGLSIKFNVRYVGLYLVIDSEIGLTVLWDFKTTVRIILQPYHMVSPNYWAKPRIVCF